MTTIGKWNNTSLRKTSRGEEDLSLSNEWATQWRVFEYFNRRYGFTRDVAAAKWNAKLPVYWTKRDNALKKSWAGARNWDNPPYSRGMLDKFMGKARAEAERRNAFSGNLVPAYTSEGWWHRHVARPGAHPSRSRVWNDSIGQVVRVEFHDLAVETTYIAGRLKFRERNGATGSARFASVLVCFDPIVRPRWV